MGVIDPVGDVDTYSFEGTPGQFIVINVDRVRMSDVDPVAELYDSSRTLVAAVDDVGPPELGDRDAEIIYRIVTPGQHFIRVYDWHTWSPDSPAPEGGPTYTYRLKVRLVDPANNELEAIDEERGDTLADALSVYSSTRSEPLIGGAFEHEGDIDAFRFDLTTNALLRADIMPAGIPGYGSTASTTRIVITSTMGVEAIASLPELDRAGVHVHAGTHYLLAEHTGGALGVNPFYVLKVDLRRLPNAATEPSAEDNDTLERPAPFPLRVGQPSQILGTLPEGDVDFFRLDEPQGAQHIYVWCGSRSWGSGVGGLAIELYDPQLNLLVRDTETTTGEASLNRLPIPLDGHILGIRRGPQQPDNPSVFYICELN
ncbi:MAG: PPC domain-containing protein [Deltaproteobacteria bacterium]|nr:PPC domain-containing protein [Deltaproteobacteria bacterium]